MSSLVAVNPEIDAKRSVMPVHRLHGNSVSYRNYTAGSTSNSSVSWNITPPNDRAWLNRCIQTTIPIQITFAATTAGTNSVLESSYDALRHLAGLRILLSQNVVINGNALPSLQVREFIPDIIGQYNMEYKRKHPLGCPDMTQKLADSIGTLQGPLGGYYDMEGGGMLGVKRGSYKYTSITQSTSSAVIQLDLIDYIYIPGLLGLDQENEMGLTRIHSLDVNSSIDLSSKNVWSNAIGAPKLVDSATVITNGNASMLCKFITVPPEFNPIGPLVYNYFHMEHFKTQYGSNLIANGTAEITSNNIQLKAVPRFVFMFVKEADASQLFTDSNTFCGITGVSINFNNQTALLSSANVNDLWRISKQCGLISSLDMFKGLSQNGFVTIGTVGSLFCGAFGKHISIGDLQVGQSGSFNFNATVNIKNVHQADTLENPTLHIVPVFDHSIVIDDMGIISVELPLARPVEGEMVEVEYDNEFHGGFSLGSLISGVKKALDFAKKHQLISKIADVAAPALSLLPGKHGEKASEVTQRVGEVGKRFGFGAGVMSKSSLKHSIQNL